MVSAIPGLTRPKSVLITCWTSAADVVFLHTDSERLAPNAVSLLSMSQVGVCRLFFAPLEHVVHAPGPEDRVSPP